VLLLHDSFDYYLTVVQRLDPDGRLRVVSGAGPLADGDTDFIAWERRWRSASTAASRAPGARR